MFSALEKDPRFHGAFNSPGLEIRILARAGHGWSIPEGALAWGKFAWAIRSEISRVGDSSRQLRRKTTCRLAPNVRRKRWTKHSRWRAWPRRTVATSVSARRRIAPSPVPSSSSSCRHPPRLPVTKKEVPHEPRVVHASPDEMKTADTSLVRGKGGDTARVVRREVLHGAALPPTITPSLLGTAQLYFSIFRVGALAVRAVQRSLL